MSPMTREERTARLLASRQEAQEANHAKIREAIKRLDAARQPISISSVSREAQVARRTVYRSPFVDEIHELTSKTESSTRASEKRSKASTDRRLDHALAEVARLKERLAAKDEEITTLKRQLDKAILSNRQR